MASISSTNSVLTIAVPNLLPSVQIQGWAVDHMWDTDAIDRMEVQMGLDGDMAAGLIPPPNGYPMTLSLRADSVSVAFFDQWDQAQQIIKDVYFANGTLLVPSVNKKWNMTKGVLRRYSMVPTGGKVLGVQQMGLTWTKVAPATIN